MQEHGTPAKCSLYFGILNFVRVMETSLFFLALSGVSRPLVMQLPQASTTRQTEDRAHGKGSG